MGAILSIFPGRPYRCQHPHPEAFSEMAPAPMPRMMPRPLSKDNWEKQPTSPAHPAQQGDSLEIGPNPLQLIREIRGDIIDVRS